MFKYITAICLLFSASFCLADEHKVMVFSATWCGPCQQMKSNVWSSKEVKQYKSDNPEVKFEEIDIDKDRATMNKHRVGGVPTMIINRRDTEKNVWIEKSRKVGYTDKRTLLKWFNNVIR